jgi:putative transposase
MSYEFAEDYKIRDQSALHFLTFTIVGWIDIFTRQQYRDIILESFEFSRSRKSLRIGAYVIMSNHVHVLWQAGNNNLSDIIRDFKTHTSKSITNAIREEAESRKDWLLYLFNFYSKKTNANDYFKVWTGNNHPEEIYSEAFMKTKLSYIHQNPVRACLVANAEDYIYSSAGSYIKNTGLINIDYLF